MSRAKRLSLQECVDRRILEKMAGARVGLGVGSWPRLEKFLACRAGNPLTGLPVKEQVISNLINDFQVTGYSRKWSCWFDDTATSDQPGQNLVSTI